MVAKNTPARKNDRATRAKSETAPYTFKDPVRSPFAARCPYQRFLGLPAVVVLAAMWIAGVVILGSLALAVYVLWWALMRLAVGIV